MVASKSLKEFPKAGACTWMWAEGASLGRYLAPDPVAEGMS
ncbi:hypothetical protein ACLB1R_04820 [Escherichia coli]